LNADGSQFAEAQQNGFILDNAIGAFICLAGELKSCCIAEFYSRG
jgi:hypothetical protein